MLVLVDDLKINCLEENCENTRNIVLLHGWNNDLSIWDSILPYLSSYRVIRLDLPGFGKSDLPDKAWDVSNYTEFLKKFLEKLSIPTTVIIGHSFGGRIAIKFSAKYPEQINKLILVDSGGIRLKPVRMFLIATLSKLSRIFWLLPPLKNKKDRYRKELYKLIGSGDYLEKNPIRRGILVKVVSEDLREEAERISTPTLIIWGASDLITTLKEARILNRHIKHSRLETIENANHWPFLEKKQEFISVLNGFLDNDE